MGIATLPSASEGVLCVILVSTALPFTIVGHLIRTILFIFGIHPTDNSGEENLTRPSETYLDEFKNKTPTLRFDSVCEKAGAENELEGQDCSVCLTGFEPDSEINCISCGHVFHKACLEQWMDYWNVTCPLCRTPFVGPEDDLHCSVW